MKAAMQEAEDRGWWGSDKYVCPACVLEPHLRDIVANAVESDAACDYCGAIPAAELDVFTEAFVSVIQREYSSADNAGVSWDSREGGYIFFGDTGYDTWDLVHDQFGDVFVDEVFAEDVKQLLVDQMWVEQNYGLTSMDDALSTAWTEFSDAVKHKMRYVFWIATDVSDPVPYDEISPDQILHNVALLLDRLNIFRVLPAGTKFWRAHTHAEPLDHTAKRLGTSPLEYSLQPNRMNPAGIPMFYGAIEHETAIAEVVTHAPKEHDAVTYGLFSLSEPITVVDFSKLPEIPSVFHPEFGEVRLEISFLHDFVATLRQPVAKDEEHISYVPTQVLTEFFLHAFRPSSGETIMGMIYPSAVKEGTSSAVLNIKSQQCIDEGDPAQEQPTLILNQASISTFPRP